MSEGEKKGGMRGRGKERRARAGGEERKREKRNRVKYDFFGFSTTICMYSVHSALHLQLPSMQFVQGSKVSITGLTFWSILTQL